MPRTKKEHFKPQVCNLFAQRGIGEQSQAFVWGPESDLYALHFPGDKMHLGDEPSHTPLRSPLFADNPDLQGTQHFCALRDLETAHPGIARRWKKALQAMEVWELDPDLRDSGMVRKCVLSYPEAKSAWEQDKSLSYAELLYGVRSYGLEGAKSKVGRLFCRSLPLQDCCRPVYRYLVQTGLQALCADWSAQSIEIFCVDRSVGIWCKPV